MTQPIGSLCFVLHAHCPYVLNHGAFPHGEAWLFEAAAETYLPLIEMLADVVKHRIRPAISIGLTPILLEQLGHERFKTGFVAYLNDRIAGAAVDRAEFEKTGDPQFALLAKRWHRLYTARLQAFNRLGGDLIAPFVDLAKQGHIQLLTSCATHAYLPLLVTDESCRAQTAAGVYTSEKWLGQKPRGIWLPECAYRPAIEHWTPAVLWKDARYRPGVEAYLAPHGIDHFIVESRLVTESAPLGTFEAGKFEPVGETQAHWDKQRGWRDPLVPVGIASEPGPPSCFALARHPRVSEQVWSGAVGYPSSGAYLEFHRVHGRHGLRYHRITDVNLPLGEKQPYKPEDTFTQLHDDAQHFVKIVRQTLEEHHRITGRPGMVTAPFDAELFGHWWHEGVTFLRDVIYLFAREKSVELTTTADRLDRHRPDTVVRMPEGSWGHNADHSNWLTDATRPMWEIEYRAESRLLHALRSPWRQNPELKQMLQRAARQLLLLQASDWPFIVRAGLATDYGLQRFMGHATRFDRLCTIASSIAAGHAIDALQAVQIAEADAHDSVFAEIDLNWWAENQ